MKIAGVLACCLLVFPLIGTVSESVPKSRAKPLTSTEDKTTRYQRFRAQLIAGGELMRAGRYSDAARLLEALRTAALAAHADKIAARALFNIGGCQVVHHQFQSALRSFIEAQRMAKAAGDRSGVAIFDVSIASLYSAMGELEAATQWTQQTLARTSAEDREQMPKLLIQMATLRARQGRMPEALQLFGRGIDGADRAGDPELYALGWNRIGEEYLKQGDLAAAELPLLQAYRIRKLHHLALDSSFRNLGRLRLEQGDLTSASALLDQAVGLSQGPQGPVPSWDAYHYRGRVRLAQGRLCDSLADLRIAVRLARAWRWSIPLTDTTRVGAEGWLQLVHSALVEAGNRLYLQTREPALICETFEAAEENRANSLRALFSSPRNLQGAGLPPEYWEGLARLQRAEVAALRANGPVAEETLRATREDLIRMETASDPVSAPLPTDLLNRAQAALDADSALFSFHLSDPASWMWALDREGLVLYALPPRKIIESQVQAAARAIRQDSVDAPEVSARLYRSLLGPLAPRFRQKTRWLLALDPGMLDAPVAALIEGPVSAPTYVAENHITQVIPGVGYWLETQARRAPVSALSTVFVGVGDPIYNAADPRLVQRPASVFDLPLHLFTASRRIDQFILPRLVGSGVELDACARAWSGERMLLKGRDASRRNLLEQLRRNPAVVHFATHIVESPERFAPGLIALSLTNQSEMELLPPLEIARWRTHIGLVVLSGCHSSAGANLPGTGLTGLTRAWLMAGAQAVVGSNWDTLDEGGGLFHSLYLNLSGRQSSDAAGALRGAQLEMIRSGGWRARPRYWGAYFVVGTK